MASINTIIENLAEGIAADSVIESWSVANYDRDLTVLEGCDFRDNPDETLFPLVILYPVTKSGGLNQSDKTHIIGINCAVFDAEEPQSVNDVVRFSGQRNVEDLRVMIVDVIKSMLTPGNLHLENIVTDYDTIEQFPFVSATMEITITEPKTIGSDPYE